MRERLKQYLLINVGLLIMAFGLHFFLIPADLAVGGVTGLAMVIKNFLPSTNLGLLMGVFNVILFTLAFILIDREFGSKSIYCSIALSVIIGVFEVILPFDQPVVDDIVLNLTFGIIIQGIGMAAIFYQNASTGGTDIVARIINKYTHLGIGKALFLADSLITLLAGFIFGVELGLYAFLGILINGLVIDKVIAGINTKIQIQIISCKPEIVNKYVHQELGRGSTLFSCSGGYTNKNKQVISVVLTRREYMKLKYFLKKSDPSAFVTVNFVYEVLGEGFDLMLQK